MKLTNKRVAILATDGFERSELASPKEAMEKEGAEVHIISNKNGKIKAWDQGQWSDEWNVDNNVESASANDYNALLVPGGVINPDSMRTNEAATRFVRSFFEQKKPVAAICHGPQVLINADVLKGRKVTSYNSIRKDVENAGAQWEDSEVVVDKGLVTSRNPGDLPAFKNKLIEEIREGKHERQAQSV